MNEIVRSLETPALSTLGGIDCDVHPAPPPTAALLAYLDEYWRETFVMRGVDRLSLAMTASPPRAPINARPDWRVEGTPAGAMLETVRAQALDPFGTRIAICNPLHGAMIMHSDDMAAALCGAVNEWLAREWLDKEPRLRGSIMISAQNTELAIAEIERRAGDRRFVQVLILAQNDEPLGRRRYWPIYEAAARHGLPVCVHAGGSARHAPTATGWPSYFVEAHVAQAAIFESQLLSLVSEGVFAKIPDLKIVFAEAGFTWLPSFFWRADKTWRGVRAETPWVKEPPSDIVKRHVRFTLQPVEAPPEPDALARTLDHIACDDILLFSTDYPHWHFEGTAALSAAFGETLAKKILIDNPLATYPRIAADLSTEAAR
ncbi:amidohydrolase family protein [Aquamicrobium sp. LC103]|uniref:amidohydrolase family protein n=1 Tax=Aquamicrobium sp. LC103 TaxID=1120658 RepID=UPI00063ECF71|nr:amidohydrolase family protein [Aquamicrobium sp. LC103]TKT74604.1 amidohydrolase [Aquamicrobium sp. LC103]